MDYILKRSKRKSIGLEVTDEGLLVRAPVRTSRREIDRCIRNHQTWIARRMRQREQGSCSSKGNLNFNCLLMLAPPEVIDSVVVHEVCHLLEMNHSKRFYEHVYCVYPEYKEHHGWLRKHGPELMARVRR